jgi:hypothetical protein
VIALLRVCGELLIYQAKSEIRHRQVGLKDCHYAREGRLSNPQIAERAAGAIQAMWHEVETPAGFSNSERFTGDAQITRCETILVDPEAAPRSLAAAK